MCVWWGGAEKNFEQSDRVEDGSGEFRRGPNKELLLGDDESQNYGVITGDMRLADKSMVNGLGGLDSGVDSNGENAR